MVGAPQNELATWVCTQRQQEMVRACVILCCARYTYRRGGSGGVGATAVCTLWSCTLITKCEASVGRTPGEDAREVDLFLFDFADSLRAVRGTENQTHFIAWFRPAFAKNILQPRVSIAAPGSHHGVQSA